jgi:hypothetical protein
MAGRTAPRAPARRSALGRPEDLVGLSHIASVRKVLAACNAEVPTEDLMVRLPVGSGIRRAEVCGLAVTAPDARGHPAVAGRGACRTGPIG